MTKIQVMGPTKKSEGPVTLQKRYTRSPTSLESQFMVTFKLGNSLRRTIDSSTSPSTSPQSQLRTAQEGQRSPTDHSKLPKRKISTSLRQELQTLRQNSQISPKQLWPESISPISNLNQNSKTPFILNSGNSDLSSQTSPFAEQYRASFINPPRPIDLKINEHPKPVLPRSDSESDIEILEVRHIPLLHPQPVEPTDDSYHSDEDTTDGDLSFLQEEIDFALSSVPTRASDLTSSPQKSTGNMVSIHKLLPNLCRQVQPRSPPPPGFRNIPPNLVNALQRELHFFFDQNNDDDVEVVGKMAFSLKDPIARTKIQLPIKATTCRHFECFDFKNFCLFYGLPPGIQHTLKSTMLMQSKESRETEALFYEQQRSIAEGRLLLKSRGLVFPQFSEHGQMFFTDVYCRTPPLYKCPLCDEKFGLKQLYISDIFNFFVKTTPSHITRIELVQNDRYKIIEEETIEKAEEQHEVVELDDDDEFTNGNKNDSDDEYENRHLANLRKPDVDANEVVLANRSMTADDFNDGLDDVLIGLKQGDGSWHHPLTLD